MTQLQRVQQFLVKEHIASIRDVQKNPSKSLQGITRVMRGSKTLGFFFANDELEELLEDIEAAASRPLRARVKKARQGLKKKDVVPLSEIVKAYGL